MILKKLTISIMLFLVALSLSAAVVEAGPGIAVAETEKGLIQGYIRDGIYTFHDIPYAHVEKRFVPAVETEPWDGIFFAGEYGDISAQSQFTNTMGNSWEEPARISETSEDPLNLNIWTPGLDDGNRPVMVWLHGGGFEFGSAHQFSVYDGANLSRKGDVVVVSVNHRLNVLGFLDLSAYGDEYALSANVGILDIIDALKWMQKNIAAFGGDPDNVTLFGQSGGGSKVTALMAAPYAEGLFERGIVESGGNTEFMTKETSERIAAETMAKLGITEVEELQNVPYEELQRASSEVLAELGEEAGVINPVYGTYTLIWEPVTDGVVIATDTVTENGFVPSGRNYGLMVGANLTEFAAQDFALNPGLYQDDNPHSWSEEETENRLEEAFGDDADAIVNEFLSVYPDKEPGDVIYIDTGFRAGMEMLLNAKAESGEEPVYAYIFSWESPMMNGVFTAYHTAELPFVFNNIDKVDTIIPENEESLALEDKMSQA